MTETPRTDAAEIWLMSDGRPYKRTGKVRISFARELETSLIAAQKELEHLRDTWIDSVNQLRLKDEALTEAEQALALRGEPVAICEAIVRDFLSGASNMHSGMHYDAENYLRAKTAGAGRCVDALRNAAPTGERAVPFEDYKLARDALLYWQYECSGAEPSLSVFNRMVGAALAQDHTPAVSGERAAINSREMSLAFGAMLDTQADERPNNHDIYAQSNDKEFVRYVFDQGFIAGAARNPVSGERVREACAKACKSIADDYEARVTTETTADDNEYFSAKYEGAKECEAAIRALPLAAQPEGKSRIRKP